MNNDIATDRNGNCSIEAGRSLTNTGFGSRGWTVIIFQAMMFWLAAGAITHGLNVVLPALSNTFHLDYAKLLALATPASWVSIFGGPFSSWLCEKKGAKFNTIFCLIACGICLGLLGHFGSFTGFTILFAGVCFFGTGFGYIGGTAIVASWFVRKAGLALGWCTLGQTFSSALYVPAVATLFAYFGVEYGLWGISILMFIMALLLFLFIANKPEDVGLAPDNEPLSLAARKEATASQEKKEKSSISLKKLLKMRDIWLMGIATGAIYIMLVGVVSQLVPRLMEMGFPQNKAIFYMSAFAMFGLFGAYGWGKLNDILGVKPALIVYTIWWIVSIILNLFSANPICLWISMTMIGFSLPGATNLSTALIATKFPRQLYIRAIGIVHPVQSIVRCFAFTILSLGLTYLGGFTGAYMLLIGVGVITIILFLIIINTTPVNESVVAE